MKSKNLFEKILFYLSAPRCIGCGERLDISDFVLCDKCLKSYFDTKTRNCSVCFKPTDECTCVNKYLSTHYIRKLFKVYRYSYDESLPSSRLIFALKRANRKDVIDFLSDEIVESIRRNLKNPEKCIFTNVPRRKKSIIEFGYDHAAELSKMIAKKISAQYYQPLYSKVKLEQKSSPGAMRLTNASFLIKHNAKSLEGKRVVVVDDVVTTGASMGAVAMLLRGLGAKQIFGATIAVVFRDAHARIETSPRF